METLWVESTEGVVDFAKLSLPVAAAVEVEVADSTLPSLVLRSFHLINSTHVSIGSNVSYSLSEPIELSLSTESYTGPVLDRMMLPSGLKSLTIVETPKSGSLARIALPSGLQTLEIHLTGVFSPVDEMHLPETLTKLVVRGEHNCSLELLKIPPSLTHIDTGSSAQPVDRLQTGVETRVVSRVGVGVGQPPQTTTPFEERLTLTSSHPMVLKMHAVLPTLQKLQHVSAILDKTMWQSVGDVWCKLLLEGRVHTQTLFLINTPDNVCMRDFGEVLYRADRLGRPLCNRVHVMGETFDYATCLRVAEAIRKVGYDLQVDIDYATAFPVCALHRVASVLGAGFRDGDLAYHSQDTNVEYNTNGNTLSFTKVASPDPSIEDTHVENKPITLYSWQSCGFCKEQEAIIKDLLEHGEGDTIEKFHRLVAVKNLQNPQDAGDERIKMFPTWVINGTLAPGLKQREDIQAMLNEL